MYSVLHDDASYVQKKKKKSCDVQTTAKTLNRRPLMEFAMNPIVILMKNYFNDRPCGLEVRVLGYRSRDSGFDSRRYHIFWKAVGLERGPLSLLSITEELLGGQCSGSGLENQEYGRGDPLRWPSDTLYHQKVDTNFTDKRRSLGRCSSLANRLV
jgi:hypothetical protein